MPGDPAWGDEIKGLDRNCGSREHTTGPCEIDRVAAPMWHAIDLAMTVAPGGWTIKALRAATVIREASGGGGSRGPDEVPLVTSRGVVEIPIGSLVS